MKKLIIAAAIVLVSGALSSQTAGVRKTKQPVIATQCLLTATVSKNIASADWGFLRILKTKGYGQLKKNKRLNKPI